MEDPDPRRVSAVVLAAGAGKRFGGGKLLASLEGRPVLQHVLDHLAAAGVADVLVVLGDDALEVARAIDWRGARPVVNPDPSRGLSSSLRVGIAAVGPGATAVLILLGDQPDVRADVIRALIHAPPDRDRPIVVPRYVDDGGRNPVLVRRAAFDLVAQTSGDRGLGPVLADHPELVQEVPMDVTGNPDLDTRDDLAARLERAWAERVEANAAQVERHREVPDGSDFYAPVTGLFRADPTRTDEPVLEELIMLTQPGETWLDIGAGAGRYALPIARELAASGGSVIAVDPSRGMLDALRETAHEHAIDNVRVVEGRWPDVAAQAGPADVSLIAHVSYDIGAIGPFLAAMEMAARRVCVAVLMERQPSSIADACWPSTWGEERVSLPALPEFVELLRAHGRRPMVRRLDREPRRFASREELTGFLRRQLWVAEGSAADRRFLDALEPLIDVDADGTVGLVGQRPLPIGVVTWRPR
jgi:CTP:molybdopterin cytidylyltransferase MocA